MADAIKASFDVPFENPFRIMPMAQQEMSLCQGISTAAFPPKAIGMAVGLRFRNRIESQQVECLHGPVGHRGNPETALFAVTLGNVHPAERLRLITVPSQSGESSRLGFRCVPEDSVHTGSLRTRIIDHSQNGQSPATKRVREQINQSLDFIPSAFLQRRSRYAPGADEPRARLSSTRWSASLAVADREPHQQAFLPPTYLLVSLESVGQGSLVMEHPM